MQDLFSNWTGREDAGEGDQGLRWHQIIRPIDEDHSEAVPDRFRIAILGFCSDEGVRRNKGRTGAAEAPAAIRRACAPLPDHFPGGTLLFEAGDVHPEGKPLEKAQEELSMRVKKLLDGNYFPLLFGGGHEIAWGVYGGLRDATPAGQSIGVINIDAHFDLRQPVHGATSGTSFYEIAEDCRRSGRGFHYLCLGIQRFSNTKALFERAGSLKVAYHLAEDLRRDNLPSLYREIDHFISERDVLYLTIDMDAFDATQAPGVSAPNALGLDPRIVVPLIRHIAKSGKVAVADIAEVNPRFDQDGRTAKLAAALAFELLGSLQG